MMIGEERLKEMRIEEERLKEMRIEEERLEWIKDVKLRDWQKEGKK